MKKSLLLVGAAIALASFGAEAETKTYTSEEFGEVTAVSPNGEYVSVYDYENNRAFLWIRATGEFKEISAPKGDSSVPSGQRVTGSHAMGVANDGTVVGCVMHGDGISHPAVYKDGEWKYLPMHGGARNDNKAIAITGDGKIIGGYQFINDPTSAIAGRYYPCRWTLDDDGEWVLESFTDIELPDHQGFYATCMSPDGEVIAGMMFAGKASVLPALVKDGELYYAEKITFKREPMMEYRGKWYCGDDENGKQIWTDDPDDPRIVYDEAILIDGSKDDAADEHAFSGGFQGIDNNGNIYGSRTVVVSQDPDSDFGKLSRGACIYNYKTDTWTDKHDYTGFTYGFDGKIVFAEGNTLLMDGKSTSYTSEFGFSFGKTPSAMYKASADGRIIGGCTYEINPASGEPQFFPFIIELDHALVDNQGSGVAGVGSEGAVISVANGVINVDGATEVAVYDINGALVSNASSASVARGLYIVVADGKASKVLVK